MIGIYSITNIINYKKYIGQSIDIKRRFRDHRWALRHNKHENDHLQKSFNKYGIDCFVFEIVCECTKEELDDLERYYIEYYDTTNSDKGYNYETGGFVNKKASDRLTDKLKQVRSCKEKTGMYGKHHSEETKALMREAALGRVLSKETKDKLSASHIGKNAKPLYCIEADMVFLSSSEAAKFAGLKSRSSIFENLAGRKSYAGRHPITGEPLHWRKVEDKIS